MEIRRIFALDGPNIWANFPVLEAWVDIGRFEDFPSNQLPGFNDRIMQWLPTMVEHRCSLGERGGFFRRLETGTWLGHVLEHVTLELQSLSHLPVGYGRAREASQRGVYRVVVRCHDHAFARACLERGVELILAAVDDRPFDLSSTIEGLREAANRLCLGPSTQAMVDAARARTLPVVRLASGDLVQIGYGAAARRLYKGGLDTTGAIAEAIAEDRALTREMLSKVGVPIPEEASAQVATDPDYRVLVVGDRAVAASRGLVDETDRLHPDVAARCVLAARTIGLDVAGVHLRARDITQSLESQGGVVARVVARPSLESHLGAAEAVVEHLFPQGAGRIPVVAVSGTSGTEGVARMIHAMLQRTDRTVGLVLSGRPCVGRRWLPRHETTGSAGRAVLTNPFVDAAVIEVSRPDVLEHGLTFEYCDVAVVTSAKSTAEDDYGHYGDPEILAKALRAPVDVVRPGGCAVLNADEPDVAGMATHCPGSVLYVGVMGFTSAVADRLREGARVLFLDGDHLALNEGGERRTLVDSSLLRSRITPGRQFSIPEFTIAFAAGLALGLSATAILRSADDVVALESDAPGVQGRAG